MTHIPTHTTVRVWVLVSVVSRFILVDLICCLHPRVLLVPTFCSQITPDLLPSFSYLHFAFFVSQPTCLPVWILTTAWKTKTKTYRHIEVIATKKHKSEKLIVEQIMFIFIQANVHSRTSGPQSVNINVKSPFF